MQLQELYKAFNEFNNFEAIDLKIQFALDDVNDIFEYLDPKDPIKELICHNFVNFSDLLLLGKADVFSWHFSSFGQNKLRLNLVLMVNEDYFNALEPSVINNEPSPLGDDLAKEDPEYEVTASEYEEFKQKEQELSSILCHYAFDNNECVIKEFQFDLVCPSEKYQDKVVQLELELDLKDLVYERDFYRFIKNKFCYWFLGCFIKGFKATEDLEDSKDNELFNTFKNLAPQNNSINSVLLQGKLPFVIEVSEDVFYIPYEVTKRSNKSVLRYGTKRFLANYTPVYDPELGCSYCAVRD